MSLVELRVELPAYSHSFAIQAPATATVLDVKQCISTTCAGAPRVDGQRLIWRGRALSDDERLDNIWKAPNEPRIVHLAVHPTAWTGTPPMLPQSSVLESAPVQAPLNTRAPPPASSALAQDLMSMLSPPSSTSHAPQPASDPLAFVMYRHQTAIQALTQTTEHVRPASNAARHSAALYVESLGWAWPAILDEEFPPRTPGGVKYKQIVHEGANYLSIEDASQTPTAAQVHAIRVLSYTLAILKSDPPVLHRIPSPSPALPTTLSPQVTALLQQLGIRNLPANTNFAQPGGQNAMLEVPIRNQMPAPDLPQMQMRPFLLPITFILLRIFLLLYFFAPARKPFMGAIILAWAAYEIWTRHIRGREPAAQVRRNALDRMNHPVGNEAPVNGGAGNVARPVAPRRPQTPLALLDSVASVNLEQEDATLDGTVTSPPTFLQKAQLFATLFFGTLHPAVWDRRRALLRQREGRLRTEANAMRPIVDESDTAENRARTQTRAELAERHNRRPAFVQEYIHRVVENDWVED